ncbi:type II secretion system protein GspK [Aureimonas pseudogalii]|uniref:General secretion pathway protein K n=1 Tax=Aureimonas pseudogalii TaxID=1744844 RepID=A0A7W6H3N0_9HYPH|nr:type II secretion system protein GspK [Aureimonas pseudogalii]MBB3997053.1 general secretion pathway protein K [Aureimonas pseudogalii]
MARREGEGEGDDGFVLLTVLVVIVLFVGLAASLAVKSRLLAMQAANRGVATRAQARVDGAALFVADALRPVPRRPLDAEAVLAAATAGSTGANAPAPALPAPLPLPVDGSPVVCRLSDDGTRLLVRVVDQGGLVDLNGAPVAMLRAVFAAAGLDGQIALRLADEVADFRDPDDDPQANGVGERAQYAQKGLPWGPRNGAFGDVGEIAQLPSADPAALARILPLLTVWNPRAGVDFTAMDVAARARLAADAARQPDLARWQLASERGRFSVEIRLIDPRGVAKAARGALVGFDGDTPGELRVQRWWRPLSQPSSGETEGNDAPVCGSLRRVLDIGGR